MIRKLGIWGRRGENKTSHLPTYTALAKTYRCQIGVIWILSDWLCWQRCVANHVSRYNVVT